MSDRSSVLRNRAGFTLVELMIVIVVLGVLVTVALPNFHRTKRNAKIGRTAAELRSLSTAFVAYQAQFGDFPGDSHMTLPPGMETYINPAVWADGTPLGGTYNWEGPDSYGYAALSIFGSTEDEEVFETLDGMLDDGDLSTGRFREINSRPTWILFGDP